MGGGQGHITHRLHSISVHALPSLPLSSSDLLGSLLRIIPLSLFLYGEGSGERGGIEGEGEGDEGGDLTTRD